MNGSESLSGIFRSMNEIDFIAIAAIVAAAWLLILLSIRFLPWLAEKVPGRHRFYLLASVPVLRLGIISGALVLVVTRLVEPSFENLVTLMGALGLALGFAFKDYASSLIAGAVTLCEAPYRPGDWIEIGGAYGEVRAVNMRTVEIVTPDDTVVFIPHMTVWQQLVRNANHGGPNLQCVADFYLHPRHDAALVRRILADVALTSAFLQIRRPVNVVVSEKPWATHYRLKAYPVDPREQFNFITDLTVRGKAALIGLGVEFALTIPSPNMAR